MDKTKHHDAPELLTAHDAARLLTISKRSLWARVAAGEIPAVRMGGRLVRFDRADLDAYLESCKRR